MNRLLTSWEPNWKRRYNSPPDDLIQDFYIPAFARSSTYDRAVGFFSSSLLAAISPSIDDFVLNGGRMRLITSPANLSDDDLTAMGKGEAFKEKLKQSLESSFAAPIPNSVLRDRLKLLTWMIAMGRLEVRIALREHDNGYSLFHEKIGIFGDSENNWMTFTGSPNETMGGARRHSESFPLHRSWVSEDQREYAREEKDRFELLWNESIAGISTWKVSEWLEDKLREIYGSRSPAPLDFVPKNNRRKKPVPFTEAIELMDLSFDDISLLPAIPSSLNLRDYQKNAVNDWIQAEGRGLFAMATGTGKTITALTAATQVSLHYAKQNSPLLVLVVVPSKDLVNQWKADAEWFGFRPAICRSGLSRLQRNQLKDAFSAARTSSGQRTEMVITTADSLTPPADTLVDDHFLQRQLRKHNGFLLVIGDEMHSLGTARRLASLPVFPTHTLGLSATPKRHGDEEGTEQLIEYFGAPVVSISIKNAIYQYKCLVEYDYFPIQVELTNSEAVEYKRISAKIAAAYANNDEQAAEIAIRLRTRLIQHATNKIFSLQQLMASGLSAKSHQIIYVAEGSNPETQVVQMTEVQRILRDEFAMTVECYYGETKSDRREILQKQLADGEIQALIAMKCLDEGVDIPSARIGLITASTQNPRQFVQRRGRLLRRDPDNPKSHAEIYDFIVLPPQGSSSDSEKTLIGAQLSRAAELADAARNREVLFNLIEWAYNFGIDQEKFTWMKLTEDIEMEERY